MIIAINGRENSGKDTIGKIIQYLTSGSDTFMSYEEYLTSQSKFRYDSKFEIKKFAATAVKCFELITGTNFHKLNREEKEKIRPLFVNFIEGQKDIFGQEVWADNLCNQYKMVFTNNNGNQLPDWIITDLRFPVEYNKIIKWKPITIYVKRPLEFIEKARSVKDIYKIPFDINNKYHKLLWDAKENRSTNQLNNIYDFKYTISNHSDLNYLVEQVKKILIKENLYNV